MTPEPPPAPTTHDILANMDAMLHASGASDPATVQLALAQTMADGHLGP
jgi:hypothetical protein